MSKEEYSEVSDLRDLLGDNADTLLARGPNRNAFKSAMEELAKEKEEALLGKAKEKIKAVLEAESELDQLVKEFNGRCASARKKLSKATNALRQAMGGNQNNDASKDELAETEQ